jgi:hypothetical protein
MKAQNKNLDRDNTPTVDEQLNRLEDDIRRLKVEFDIFLAGGSKRPPYDTKNRVESVIKRIADDRTLIFAQRYRYNSLVARHTALRDVWRRTLQEREIGRERPSFARNRTLETEKPTPETPSATFACADGHKEIDTVRQLYNALIDAKIKNGETETEIPFPRFHHLIASETDKAKEKLGCERLVFSVEVEAGRVSLKKKPEE